ncbi:MAG: hypothetical protein IPO65_20995 [Saprospiraceae bacterium]|nr:hypothetical protein [Saprospiraceae bacterium]
MKTSMKYKAPPRVEIANPFISGFHTNLSKPKLGNFATVCNDEYRGEPTGCESSVTISQNGAGGIGIAQTQGAGGSSGVVSVPMRTLQEIITITTADRAVKAAAQ